jgi:hypothetical protein
MLFGVKVPTILLLRTIEKEKSCEHYFDSGSEGTIMKI